jgi:hypothetical protein
MKHRLSLTRWHSVAERIKAAVSEREARAIASRDKADLAFVEAALSAIAAIRGALARRNVELGIADKLAEAEAVSRRAMLYLAIVEKERGGKGTTDLENLILKLAADQALARVLLDQVVALNRAKLELELPDELTVVAGLAA